MWLVNLSGLPQELIILITAAAPIIEVRGAVPLAILYFKLPPLQAVLLSVFGSILPVIPILWFLNTLTDALRKIKVFDHFFAWLFHRTKAKSKIIGDLEVVGLTLFVAIPLPGTGVWTGCVAAYLLGLRWLPTFIAVTIGTSIASLLLLAASLGIINFLL